MAIGGGSADRKAYDLAAAGDPAAGAWAAGAAGERRVADELARFSEAWTVLHDRLLSPGLSPVNLDHVVVGPGGAYFIDAKNWRGAITAWEGNLYQHTGGADARQSVSKHQEVAKVHGMAAYMAAESGLAVTPVICLAGHHESEFGEAQLVRGVWVVSASALAAWLLSRPVVLERQEVERASVTLMTSFPSTTTDPQLLTAMGAATAAKKPQRKGRPSRRTAPGPSRAGAGTTRAPQRRGLLGRMMRTLMVACFAVAVFALVLKFLPGFLAGGLTEAVTGNDTPVAGPTQAATSKPAPSSTPAKSSKKPAAPPAAQAAVPVSRCAGLSAAQVGKIIGRTVHPIATTGSCAWGARLDDARTTLVEVRAMAKHPAYERNFVLSESQRRTVFGAAYLNYTSGLRHLCRLRPHFWPPWCHPASRASTSLVGPTGTS